MNNRMDELETALNMTYRKFSYAGGGISDNMIREILDHIYCTMMEYEKEKEYRYGNNPYNKNVKIQLNKSSYQKPTQKIIQIYRQKDVNTKNYYYILEFPSEIHKDFGQNGDFEKWESIEKLFAQNQTWIGNWNSNSKKPKSNIKWVDEIDLEEKSSLKVEDSWMN